MSIEFTNHTCTKNLIGGIMVSMLTSNGVDHGCEPRLGHNEDYEIGICSKYQFHSLCYDPLKIFTTIPLSTQLLRNKTKGWLDRNQDNVSEWSEMTIR